MEEGNMDIIYIRAYGGSLIPISKVKLVTVDPNNGTVQQEIPMTKCIAHLMHMNQHNFEKPKDFSWD